MITTTTPKGRPEFKKHVYKLNGFTGYYEQIFAPIGFTKLPKELRLETPFREDYKRKGVKFILKSRQVNGKTQFQTGLILSGGLNLYFGDHFHPSEKKKNSFCLVRFSEMPEYLTIYYFNHFKVYPNKRGLFIANFLKDLQ
jgi:hypothetical protein